MSILKRRASASSQQPAPEPKKKSLSVALSVARMAKKKNLKAASLKGDADPAERPHPASIVEALRQRKAEKDAQVDLDENNAEVMEDNLEEMNKLAMEDDLYSVDEQAENQPKDSNLKDREIDGDKHDMVNAIRMRMKRHGKTMLK